MPKMLQVRDVPDDIHGELTRLARRPTLAELLDRASGHAVEPLTIEQARADVVAGCPDE